VINKPNCYYRLERVPAFDA